VWVRDGFYVFTGFSWFQNNNPILGRGDFRSILSLAPENRREKAVSISSRHGYRTGFVPPEKKPLTMSFA
jgi:hypothetical protein